VHRHGPDLAGRHGHHLHWHPARSRPPPLTRTLPHPPRDQAPLRSFGTPSAAPGPPRRRRRAAMTPCLWRCKSTPPTPTPPAALRPPTLPVYCMQLRQTHTTITLAGGLAGNVRGAQLLDPKLLQPALPLPALLPRRQRGPPSSRTPTRDPQGPQVSSNLPSDPNMGAHSHAVYTPLCLCRQSAF
jgi:hypothetical protein